MASRLGVGSGASSHLLPLVWACFARRNSYQGPPPVSCRSPAKPAPSLTVEASSSPARCAKNSDQHGVFFWRPHIPPENTCSAAQSRSRTRVLQPTPRRTIGSRANLLRERRIRGPTHSENTFSPAYPPFSRISPGRRGCVRTRIYGVCAFASGELEHTFKMCTYVRMYVRRYVRMYVRR